MSAISRWLSRARDDTTGLRRIGNWTLRGSQPAALRPLRGRVAIGRSLTGGVVAALLDHRLKAGIPAGCKSHRRAIRIQRSNTTLAHRRSPRLLQTPAPEFGTAEQPVGELLRNSHRWRKQFIRASNSAGVPTSLVRVSESLAYVRPTRAAIPSAPRFSG